MVELTVFKVPTVCIENVYLWNNTSVVADEILSHRVGLIPLNVDPDLILMKESMYKILTSPFSPLNPSLASTDQATDRNTIVFELILTCERNPKAKKDSTNPDEMYINHELLSSHLVWKPAGEQEEVFAGNPPAPTNPNIVLAKLRPGQEVHMELHAVKGVGKDHAKFCPVGEQALPYLRGLSHSESQQLRPTAYYRTSKSRSLSPHI